jgi:hypothetical protein
VLSPPVKKALSKLVMTTIVLAALILLCFVNRVGDLRGLIVFVIVVLAFPITVLTGIDASRVIKRETPSHKRISLLGRVLSFPQAVMGTILVGFSIVYPVFGIHELLRDPNQGRLPWLPIGGIGFAAICFSLGIYYIREGLNISKK